MFVPRKYAGLFNQVIAGTSAGLGVLACAAVFGWCTPILPELLGSDSDIPMDDEEASWMVAMPEFGTLFSPIPAGFLADCYGRKIIILVSAPLFFLGWVIVLYFRTLFALNVARIIQGLGVGIVYAVIPMYLGEIASAKYRGAITGIFYCLWWGGYLFEYIVGPMMSFINFTYVTAFTNVLFFLAFMCQPETPYFYLMAEDVEKARKSLAWFMVTSDAEVEEELTRMKLSVEEDKGKKVKWNDLAVNPVNRKGMMILLLNGFLRIFCGLIPLSSYSTQTLVASGDDIFISPHQVTILMGTMMFVGSICSSFTLDIFGRRSLLLLSCTVSGLTMFIIGTYYVLQFNTPVDVSAFSWIPPVNLIIFSAVAVLGIFPVSVTYTSELFDSNTRAIASSVLTVYTTILGVFAFKFYLTIMNYLGIFVNFYIYAAVCFFGAFLSCTLMPETKGKTFEQIRFEMKSF